MLQKFDERNRDLIVNINGDLIHRDEAGISPFDSAVQGGDAVWEGLRLYDGRIFKLHEHLDRLRKSATALSFAEIPPREKIIDEIDRTLAANAMHDGVHIRLTLTRGIKITSGMDPRLNQGPHPDRARGAQSAGLCDHWALFDHEQDPAPAAGNSRSANSPRQFAQLDPGEDRSEQRRRGRRAHARHRGFVAETNATHLFIVRKEISRPAAWSPVRKESPAQRCWRFAPRRKSGACETDLSPVEVYDADEMFCTGTMGELAGVTKIDDRTKARRSAR